MEQPKQGSRDRNSLSLLDKQETHLAHLTVSRQLTNRSGNTDNQSHSSAVVWIKEIRIIYKCRINNLFLIELSPRKAVLDRTKHFHKIVKT